MTDAHEVELDAATPADAALLANLLELYVHDMSEVFAVELGADGRFGYPKLSLYWSAPERHFALLIRYAGRTVGFTLVTRGSPVTDDPNALDVAEFFVLRRYRRSGVGRRAALALWQRFPGTWTVRVLERNRGAQLFWSRVVAEFTRGDVREFTRDGKLVFAFESKS